MLSTKDRIACDRIVFRTKSSGNRINDLKLNQCKQCVRSDIVILSAQRTTGLMDYKYMPKFSHNVFYASSLSPKVREFSELIRASASTCNLLSIFLGRCSLHFHIITIAQFPSRISFTVVTTIAF